jgi:hypothetical protein
MSFTQYQLIKYFDNEIITNDVKTMTNHCLFFEIVTRLSVFTLCTVMLRKNNNNFFQEFI